MVKLAPKRNTTSLDNDKKRLTENVGVENGEIRKIARLRNTSQTRL